MQEKERGIVVSIGGISSGLLKRACYVSIGCACIAFAMFGWSLDRYPDFFPDEPWWNTPAARYVDGRSFVYAIDSRAPHRDTVLNPHAPFFFRFQILTFKLLGISHFSCRIPSHLGAHLGLLFLCVFLAKNKMPASAIALAVFWIGDRSTQYTLLGRPEGFSHFFVVLTFLFLVVGVICRRLYPFAFSSLFLGVAAGFNPAAVFFGLALLAAVLLLIPRHDWRKVIGMMILGGLAPAGLMLWCWAPDVKASLEQFWYYYTISTTGFLTPTLNRLIEVYGMLGWSRFLHIWLVAISIGILLPVVVMRIRRINSSDMDAPSIVGICATLFSLAGFVLYLNSSTYPYYLIYFTIWPVAAFLSFWESSRSTGRQIATFRVLAVVLLVCWLPSLAWNAMRFRETALWWKMLDKKIVSNELKLNVQSGAEVWGDPCYFVIARNAGLKFTPLSPLDLDDPGITAPSHAWLMINPTYVEMFKRHNPAALEQRTLVHSGVAFSGSKYTEHQFFIYGPKQEEP